MQKPLSPSNPALLRWARESAGLSLREAVFRAHLLPGCRRRGEDPMTAEERLASWETGLATPTLSQLKALAKAFCRPLVTFFLSELPAQAEPMPDFRSLPGSPPDSPEFAALKRRVLVLHGELSALARDEQAEILPFVGSCTADRGVTATVEAMRGTLAIGPAAKLRLSRGSVFSALREKVQAAGVHVVFMGGPGSPYGETEPGEFLGIAVADRQTPLVVLNGNDDEAAMSFSLAHELAHVFLGLSGISGPSALDGLCRRDTAEEYCAAAAAELLLPEQALRTAWREEPGKPACAVRHLACVFGVEDQVVARRLSDAGLLGGDDLALILSRCRGRRDRGGNGRGKRRRGQNSVMPARRCFGAKTLTVLARAVETGRISLLEAARTLNLSVDLFKEAARDLPPLS